MMAGKIKKEPKNCLGLDDVESLLNTRFVSGRMGRDIQEAVFEKHGFIYVSSERGLEFIDKLFKDGRRVTGRLVGEHDFEEVTAKTI